MISKIQNAQKSTPKTKQNTLKNTKTLNSRSYDQFEENIPSPTFRVDLEKGFRKLTKSKYQLKKEPPKYQKKTKWWIILTK